MIKIIFDPEDLISAQEHKVREIAEYPQVVKSCLASLNEEKNQTIFLAQPVLLQWFKNMAARYPQGTFIFEEIDARGALEQRWQVPIPHHVANEDILEADLLSLDLSPQPGFGFEENILAHFYSPLMAAPAFPLAHIAQLLEAAGGSQWLENHNQTLFERIYRMRLEQWRQNAAASEPRELIDLFADDPNELRNQLMQFRVLRSYPQIGENLLGRMFGTFTALKLRLDDLALDEANIRDAVVQVTYHLNSLAVDTPQALEELIRSVSGLLTVEFETIESLLLQKEDWLTLERAQLLEEKFENSSSSVARRIRALRQRVRPPRPQTPDMGWGVSEMLNWAVEQYLPYQTWCLEHEAFDQEIYILGDVFSEWLVHNWSDLRANSGRMLFHFFPDIAGQLRDSGRVNLIILVDNLGWSYAETLVDIFMKYQYYPTRSQPYLAMAPSETEISKKCLLSGEPGYAAIDNKKYKVMLEKGWVPYFGDNVFRYISDIGGLRKIEAVEASAYVINYLAVDKALHKPTDEIGMPHSEHIRHLLEKLAENIQDFVEKHNLKEKIRIHFIADHGSTRIPEEEVIPNDLTIANFKTEGFEICSHRHVRVEEKKFGELADNLKVDCFFLPANDFNNDANYLCARRANRFLPTSRNAYVHGGLLPEEVIVPHFVFEGAALEIDHPTVLLPVSQFRYRKETIEFEVGNPNEIAIEDVRVSILNNNISSEPIKLKEIAAKSKQTVKIEARFAKTSLPEDQTKLRLRVRFTCRGKDYSQDYGLAILMRSMVVQGKTDLFDV